VPPHDRRGEAAAAISQVQAAVRVQFDEALFFEPFDRLRHRRRRQAEPFDDARSQRDDAFFFEREDRLDVVLGCVVQLRHKPSRNGN
jgi:hypothetical protein